MCLLASLLLLFATLMVLVAIALAFYLVKIDQWSLMIQNPVYFLFHVLQFIMILILLLVVKPISNTVLCK